VVLDNWRLNDVHDDAQNVAGPRLRLPCCDGHELQFRGHRTAIGGLVGQMAAAAVGLVVVVVVVAAAEKGLVMNWWRQSPIQMNWKGLRQPSFLNFHRQVVPNFAAAERLHKLDNSLLLAVDTDNSYVKQHVVVELRNTLVHLVGDKAVDHIPEERPRRTNQDRAAWRHLDDIHLLVVPLLHMELPHMAVEDIANYLLGLKLFLGLDCCW